MIDRGAQLRAQIASSTDPGRLRCMANEAAAAEGKPHRVQRRRARGWRMPANTVYVGRTRGDGWGNRYVVGRRIRHVGDVMVEVHDSEHAVALHRQWLDWQIRQFPTAMPYALAELSGKNLACWCRLDQPCHADTLLELANPAPHEAP